MYHLRLNNIVDMAKNTEYYKEIISEFHDEVYTNQILLTKNELQSQKERILVYDYTNAQKAILKTSRTSGTSGIYVEVYWKKEDLLRSNLCLWRERNRCYGITPNDKFVSFHSLIYSGTRLLDPGNITAINSKTNFSISKFDFSYETLNMYCEQIKSFDPTWMFLQPSSALYLFELLNQTGTNPRKIMPHLKYIELTGEVVLNSEKELLRKFFHVPVCNMYGCNEVNAIAYECPYGNMHILDDNVFVQIAANKDSKKGKILLTSLQNTVMPIIGYDIGDVVSIEKNYSCRCGKSGGYLISSIVGRNSELIELKEGKKISIYEITYCIEHVNSIMRNPILQFEVCNLQSGIVIKLKIAPAFISWKSIIEDEIINQIKLHLDFFDCPINFIYTDKFLYNMYGKQKLLNKGVVK